MNGHDPAMKVLYTMGCADETFELLYQPNGRARIIHRPFRKAVIANITRDAMIVRQESDLGAKRF